MKFSAVVAAAFAVSTLAVVPVQAKPAPRTFIVNNDAVGVPVFPHEITDRPYTVIGEVEAGIRKATLFSKEASQEKIYRELWERADKLGADAVINATYGDSHVTAFSWGNTKAKGTAIKFSAASDAVPAATSAPAAQ